MRGAGLAELHPHVDEAGGEAQAAAVDRLGVAGRKVDSERGDAVAFDEQIARSVAPAFWVDQPRIAEELPSSAHFIAGPLPGPRSWPRISRQAMRTATPISTCWRIRLRSMSSATSLPISTPRFIGPGCIIRASGFASFSLS